MTPGRWALLGIALLLLFALAWTGLSGGIQQLPQTETGGQRVQALMQVAYGFFALLTVGTTFMARRWSRIVRAGWIVSLALAAGLASVVWGDTSLALGVLSGAGAALVAVGILWMLQVGARGLVGK